MREWLSNVNVFHYRKPSIVRRKRRASDTQKETNDQGLSSKSLARLKPMVVSNDNTKEQLELDSIDMRINDKVEKMANKVKNRTSLPAPNKMKQSQNTLFDAYDIAKISELRNNDSNYLAIRRVLAKPHNRCCADCRSPDPLWASWQLDLIPMVIFICINCSGWHRSLGSHISKVKSIELDDWTTEQIKLADRTGNDKCNLYWEANKPSDIPIPKPNTSEIGSYITCKYKDKLWVDSRAFV
ncbi:Arf GTPase activating protein [Wallemia mellicola]|uniref:Arf GTPase activating protein n=2 Tax=Wallemia mellicola TaxID=1708541 RepID=A0A4T0MCE1_9BASI|nr:Arf GTPase activating protein [Wallemia mellicola CBS 633.66]TIB68865.1 hypothetical protein E3Q24_03515 [Wallemia mellicola]EIM19393.1 Arf GTPase activating protein [Wallemia mellicola CBS 633.66]TIB72184.1 hypothetical protein E3Q23_03498 [Wallemia mellicola]TIB76266.1 Arf GTPase activating protein [Wallemia mellicola]TIB80751.1 Arf GTPase activating protein [Wallemia mellicola]|eukprot:XP_006960543.1 Arf GTPase activating protein [Wallemia mellicola CBS 633.66]